MARRLVIAPLAAADLDEIGDFIGQDNISRALTFVAELEAKCRSVAASPTLYALRPDLGPSFRIAVHRRYLVVYRELPEHNVVRIERVVHGARDLRRLHLSPLSRGWP